MPDLLHSMAKVQITHKGHIHRAITINKEVACFVSYNNSSANICKQCIPGPFPSSGRRLGTRLKNIHVANCATTCHPYNYTIHLSLYSIARYDNFSCSKECSDPVRLIFTIKSGLCHSICIVASVGLTTFACRGAKRSQFNTCRNLTIPSQLESQGT